GDSMCRTLNSVFMEGSRERNDLTTSLYHLAKSRSLKILDKDRPPPSRSRRSISSLLTCGSRQESLGTGVKLPRILPASSANCKGSAKSRSFLRVPASTTIWVMFPSFRLARKGFHLSPSNSSLFLGYAATYVGEASLSNNLHQHPFRPPAVEFAVENLLPRAEVEFAFGDRHDHFAAHDLPFVVGVGVVL